MKILTVIILCLLIFMSACHNRKNPTNIGNTEFPSEIVNFIPYIGNPIFQGTEANTWDDSIRERGFILYEDSVYKMWYTGYNHDVEKKRMLGYATSSDGINWLKYSDKPISDLWIEDMFVFKYEHLYYMYAEGEKDVAHMLTSFDGIQWKEQGNLIILSEKGDTILPPYGTPTIWIENDIWYLFYERNDLGIWLATTKDKITWKNVQDKPVLALGPDEYDKAAVAANQIVKLKNRYYMYYHATDRGDWEDFDSPAVWTSNVAMSTDLIHWKKYAGNPFIKGDYSSPILVFDGDKPSLYTMHLHVCRYISE